MKKRFSISNKLLLILFIAAVIFSVVAVYFSVYADTPQSSSNGLYKSYYAYPPREARVGVVVGEGGAENATSTS